MTSKPPTPSTLPMDALLNRLDQLLLFHPVDGIKDELWALICDVDEQARADADRQIVALKDQVAFLLAAAISKADLTASEKAAARAVLTDTDSVARSIESRLIEQGIQRGLDYVRRAVAYEPTLSWPGEIDAILELAPPYRSLLDHTGEGESEREYEPEAWVAVDRVDAFQRQAIATYLASPEAEKALAAALHEFYGENANDTCWHDMDSRAILAAWHTGEGESK